MQLITSADTVGYKDLSQTNDMKDYAKYTPLPYVNDVDK